MLDLLAARLAFAVPPVSPMPTTEPDPFAPDPTIWPEAPEWLQGAQAWFFAGAVVLAVVLPIFYFVGARRERKRALERKTTDWVDLTDFNLRGKRTERPPRAHDDLDGPEDV